jgi:FAD/FMN-containing dehydrogenase
LTPFFKEGGPLVVAWEGVPVIDTADKVAGTVDHYATSFDDGNDRNAVTDFCDSKLGEYFNDKAARARDPEVRQESLEFAKIATDVSRIVANGGAQDDDSVKTVSAFHDMKQKVEDRMETPLIAAFAFAKIDEFAERHPFRWARMQERQPDLVRTLKIYAQKK